KVQVNIDAGQNPPDGGLVSYWLRDAPEGDVTLTFMDSKGKQIRQFKSAPPEPKEKDEKALTPEQRRSEELKKAKEPKVPKEAGLNRFAWNMRHPDAARVEDDPTWESAEATLAGPVSPPGQYRVRLEVGGERHEAAFEIRQDPRNYPAKLNLKIGGLAMSVGGADFAPTKAMYDVFEDLSKRAETQLAKWRGIAKTDVPAFDKLVRGSGVPAVTAVREKKRE